MIFFLFSIDSQEASIEDTLSWFIRLAAIIEVNLTGTLLSLLSEPVYGVEYSHHGSLVPTTASEKLLSITMQQDGAGKKQSIETDRTGQVANGGYSSREDQL